MCRSLESEFDSELGLVTGRRHGLCKGSRHALLTGLGGRHSRQLFSVKRRIPRKLTDRRESERARRREPESRVASVKLRAYAREKVERLPSTFFYGALSGTLGKKKLKGVSVGRVGLQVTCQIAHPFPETASAQETRLSRFQAHSRCGVPGCVVRDRKRLWEPSQS
jgi:hypothetical protein